MITKIKIGIIGGGQLSRMMTLAADIERADESLIDLFNEGYLIYPSPQIVQIIQDKAKQK